MIMRKDVSYNYIIPRVCSGCDNDSEISKLDVITSEKTNPNSYTLSTCFIHWKSPKLVSAHSCKLNMRYLQYLWNKIIMYTQVNGFKPDILLLEMTSEWSDTVS